MGFLEWFELYFASEWLIRLVMLFEAPRRRSPAAATAWLTIVFFSPWVGLVLYLFIGANRPQKHKVEQYGRLQKALQKGKERFARQIKAFRPELDLDSEAVAAFVERLGGMPVFGGNQVELIAEAEQFIDRLVADIDAATHHVHLLFYIYEDDAIGRRVNDALARAVKRGVSCRLLLDALGSRKMLKRQSSQLLQAGIEVHDALPLLSWRRFLGRADWRNHRKIVVVDGRIAYTGSQNIVDPSYGHNDPALVWRDLVARLTGPAVIQLQAIFRGDWFMETGRMPDDPKFYPTPHTEGGIQVQALPSGPIHAPHNYKRLVLSALFYARRQVTITTPYFVPDSALMQAIEIACRRGVELRLVVPKKSDQFLPGNAARAYFEDLLRWGVKVYRYTGGLLHAKSMSIDERFCFFGSSNFDIRSFALDFEVDLVFYGAEETRELRAHQQAYIEQSELLTIEHWNTRSKMQHMIENVAKLFSPLL